MKLKIILLYLFVSVSNAAPVYSSLGDVTNDSNPSIWENFNFDITSLISGASSAQLSFGLRNDYNSSSSTTSEVFFGVENSDYFVNFAYKAGGATSHWRNVELNIDGQLYLDQFGQFTNHLGDENLGTAWQGGGVATNILGETGHDASIYIMTATSAVPLPAAVWLFGSGLIGLISMRRKSQKMSGKYA